MGSPTIFKGTFAKVLASSGIEFKDGTQFQSGTVDPSFTATTGTIGSLYLNTTTGDLYQKKDSGSSTNWKPLDFSSITTEPTGFQNPDSWTVDFNSTTRVVTVTPTGTQAVYRRGTKYTFSAPLTITIGAVQGDHFVILNTAGSGLSEQSTPWDLTADVPVIYVYWDTVLVDGFAVRETHGAAMDGTSHRELHETIGTYRVSGGTVSGITVYTPPSDVTNPLLASINPDVAATVVADEDLRTTIPAFTQDGIVSYGKMRKQFVSNKWVWDVSDVNAPYFQSGSVPQYNPSSGGDSLAIMINEDYVCYYLFAVPAASGTRSQQLRYVWIPGQVKYSPATPLSVTTRTAARDSALAETFTSLDLTGLPFTEFCCIYKVVVRFLSTFTNNVYRLRVEGIQNITGTKISSVNIGAVTPTVHGTLTGRSVVAQHPDSAINTTSTTAGGYDSTVETDQKLMNERLFGFDYVADWVTGTDYRVGNHVVNNGTLYRVPAAAAHTSGTFATDWAAGKWYANNHAITPTYTITTAAGSSLPTQLGRELTIPVAGTGGAPVTANVQPFGTVAPNDGQIYRLIGTSDVATVTYASNNNTKGMMLNGNCTLGAGQMLSVTYNAVADRYDEIGRSTNAVHTHATTAQGGQLTDAALSAAVGFAKGGTGLTALGTPLQQLRTNLAANAMEWATPVGATNYVINPDAEVSASSNLTLNGGTNTVTAARETTAKLFGSGTFKFTQAVAGAWRVDWATNALDLGLSSRLGEVSVVLQGAAVTGGKLQVLDGSNNVIFEKDISTLTSATKPVKTGGTFPIPALPSTLTVRILGTAAIDAGGLFVDQVYIGQAVSVTSGGITTDWTSYTPTFANTTLGSGSTVAGRWRRVGTNVEIQAFVQLGTGGLLTGNIGIGLPAGISVDTTKLADLSNSPLGSAYSIDSSASQYFTGLVRWSNVRTQLEVIFAATTNVAWNATVPFTWAASDTFTTIVSVPITGWQPTDIATPEVSLTRYFYNTGSTATAGGSNAAGLTVEGPTGASVLSIDSVSDNITTFNITVPTFDSNRQKITLELNDGNGWTDSNLRSFNGIRQGAAFYGVSNAWSSATNVQIFFGNRGARASNTTYGSSGDPWSNYTTWKWRLALSPRDTQSFYMQGPVKGGSSGVAVASSYLGNMQAATISNTTFTATDTTYTLASLALGQGTYLCSGNIAAGTAGTTRTRILGNITSNVADTANTKYSGGNSSTENTTTSWVALPSRVITIPAGGGTVYIRGSMTFTGTAPATSGSSMFLEAMLID
jgi:hypothetical protein